MARALQMIKPILVSLVIFITVGGIIYLGIRALSNEARENPDNPHEYDLGNLKSVNSSWVHYHETESITPPLKKLRALGVDLNDKIYIAGDSLLLIYHRTGNEIRRMNMGDRIHCLTISDSGDIFLGMEKNIRVLDASGAKKAEWTVADDRVYLTSIAVDNGNVFVADAGNRVVFRFDRTGKLLNRIGDKDEAREIPGFVIPSPYFDLALGRDASLWVVNPGRHAFENYAFDGYLRTSWQKSAMSIDGFCGCCNPSHFAMLSDGSFVTSEKGLVRVKIHAPTGELASVVTLPSQFDEETVGMDLAVDSQARILVLDPKRRQVRIFVLNAE